MAHVGSTWRALREEHPGPDPGDSPTVRAALGEHASWARVAIPCSDRATGVERPWPCTFSPEVIWQEGWEDEHGVDPPPQGDLTRALADRLVEVLAEGRPDRCCLFATWTGYADLRVPATAALELPPDRPMVAVEAALAEVHEVAAHLGRYPLRWSASDGSWAVGADLYARSVVVGGRDLRALLRQAGASPVRAVAVDGSAPLPTFPA